MRSARGRKVGKGQRSQAGGITKKNTPEQNKKKRKTVKENILVELVRKTEKKSLHNLMGWGSRKTESSCTGSLNWSRTRGSTGAVVQPRNLTGLKKGMSSRVEDGERKSSGAGEKKKCALLRGGAAPTQPNRLPRKDEVAKEKRKNTSGRKRDGGRKNKKNSGVRPTSTATRRRPEPGSKPVKTSWQRLETQHPKMKPERRESARERRGAKKESKGGCSWVEARGRDKNGRSSIDMRGKGGGGGGKTRPSHASGAGGK